MEELSKLVNKKIYKSPSDLKHFRDECKKEDLKVVFTNGCFDLLHLGHLSYLSQARALGDRLIVGVNSDTSVSKLKGPDRPIKSQDERLVHLAILSMVDAVIVFNEDTPARLIKNIQPDILVKGGDYKPEEVVGKDWVEQHGGQVVILSFLDGYSTTQLVNKIKLL